MRRMNDRLQAELLSPAGDMRSLEAALKNGADAIYMGAKAFGARSSAGFDDAALQQALDMAHLYGKRIYITLNTLIKEHEFADALALARSLEQMGVDALIGQDLGLLQAIKQQLPLISIHASTQMAIHNAAGAQLLREQGADRVVLARECSLETLEKVTKTGIEVEVFVHGALCISVSGQCLLSSQIGGRSGNRGRCAQPCRLQYRYRSTQGAWLSASDLSLADDLPALLNVGVTSFKIEGRLKRPEYVAEVTRVYRQALDAALAGLEKPLPRDERTALAQVFNRGGFTRGYAFSQADAGIVHSQHVSHQGIPLGIVISTRPMKDMYLSQIKAERSLHNGDQLQIHSSVLQEMIYAGPEIPVGGVAGIRHYKPAAPGDKIGRLVDAVQMERANATISASLPSIPLHASLRVRSGAPAELCLSDDLQRSVCVQGDCPQPAKGQPLTAENTRTSITKTGGTPYAVSGYDFVAEDACFLPVSSLNALRRTALEAMTARRVHAHERAPAAELRFQSRPSAEQMRQPDAPTLFVRTRDITARDAFLAAGADHFMYSPEDYADPALSSHLAILSARDIFCLPRQSSDTNLQQLHAMVCAAGLPVLLENAGQLQLSWPRQVYCGSGIPAWNSQALRFLASYGCNAYVLSPELTGEDMQALSQMANPEAIMMVYGRTTDMLLNHCPERTYRGLSKGRENCALCLSGQGLASDGLVDRLGATFPLRRVHLPKGCLVELLHHKPLHLSKRAFGNRWLLDFSDEPLETALSITRYYAALLRQEPLPALDLPRNYGRLEEGVE